MGSHSIRNRLEGQRDQDKTTAWPLGPITADVRRRELRHAVSQRTDAVVVYYRLLSDHRKCGEAVLKVGFTNKQGPFRT